MVMPTLQAGTYQPPTRTSEAEKQLASVLVEMRAKAEEEARRVAEERRLAENTMYELRRKRR